MGKAGVPKKAKPKPKLTDKNQSERFIETARKLGIDNKESADHFSRTFKKLVPPKLTPR
jgi:hypothetical protein